MTLVKMVAEAIKHEMSDDPFPEVTEGMAWAAIRATLRGMADCIGPIPFSIPTRDRDGQPPPLGGER